MSEREFETTRERDRMGERERERDRHLMERGDRERVKGKWYGH
jgi:hypothetical protein